MITKYYCEECCELKLKKEIAVKYNLNIGGKYPVTEYICKKCNREKRK